MNCIAFKQTYFNFKRITIWCYKHFPKEKDKNNKLDSIRFIFPKTW